MKSKNVLLTSGRRAKVSDVGTAALHSATYLSTDTNRFAGTLAWAAPELLMGHKVSSKADVYSLGVVLWYAGGRGQAPRAAWLGGCLAGGGCALGPSERWWSAGCAGGQPCRPGASSRHAAAGSW